MGKRKKKEQYTCARITYMRNMYLIDGADMIERSANDADISTIATLLVN